MRRTRSLNTRPTLSTRRRRQTAPTPRTISILATSEQCVERAPALRRFDKQPDGFRPSAKTCSRCVLVVPCGFLAVCPGELFAGFAVSVAAREVILAAAARRLSFDLLVSLRSAAFGVRTVSWAAWSLFHRGHFVQAQTERAEEFAGRVPALRMKGARSSCARSGPLSRSARLSATAGTIQGVRRVITR